MIQAFCFLAILLMSLPAWACQCSAWPSAKDAWLNTPVVFLGLVENSIPDPVGPRQWSTGTQLVRVVEPFKRAQRGQLFVINKSNDSCTPTFEAGQRVLLYLFPIEGPIIWRVAGCHRSRDYSDAMDDLLFLRKLPVSARGNRLSGEVMLKEGGPKHRRMRIRSFPGLKVTAIPKSGPSLTTTTNADGIYEWYGLAPGSYKVEIAVPKGLTIDSPSITGLTQTGRNGTIQLGRDSGVNVDFVLEANTKISGRVLAPDGSPRDGARVTLRSFPWNHQEGRFAPSDYTKSGKFEFKKIPPGRYYLVLNSEGRQTVLEPFPTLYFPGTTDIQQAVPVTVPEGGTVENLDFRIPWLRKFE